MKEPRKYKLPPPESVHRCSSLHGWCSFTAPWSNSTKEVNHQVISARICFVAVQSQLVTYCSIWRSQCLLQEHLHFPKEHPQRAGHAVPERSFPRKPLRYREPNIRRERSIQEGRGHHDGYHLLGAAEISDQSNGGTGTAYMGVFVRPDFARG